MLSLSDEETAMTTHVSLFFFIQRKDLWSQYIKTYPNISVQ